MTVIQLVRRCMSNFVQLRLDSGFHILSPVMGIAFLPFPLSLSFLVSTQQNELRELHLVPSYAC